MTPTPGPWRVETGPERTGRQIAEIVEGRRYALIREKHTFAPGDVIRWKKGCRNRILPKDNEPAIVVKVLTEPIIDERAEPGSTYFREPLDLLVGVLDNHSDMLVFHFDSHRFEPYPSEELGAPARLPSHGRGWQGLDHRARDVGRQPARLPGLLLQGVARA